MGVTAGFACLAVAPAQQNRPSTSFSDLPRRLLLVTASRLGNFTQRATLGVSWGGWVLGLESVLTGLQAIWISFSFKAHLDSGAHLDKLEV